MHLWTLWVCIFNCISSEQSISFLLWRKLLCILCPHHQMPLLPSCLLFLSGKILHHSFGTAAISECKIRNGCSVLKHLVVLGSYSAPCSWLTSHLHRDNFCLSSCWFLKEKINRQEANSFIEVGLCDRKGLCRCCERKIISIQFNMNQCLLKMKKKKSTTTKHHHLRTKKRKSVCF